MKRRKNIDIFNGAIIAVDFDGTLCENRYPEIGRANQEVIDFLINAKNDHNAKIILWTCRIGDRLREAACWCANHELIFDAVNKNLPETVAKYGGDSRKIYADIYIDDHNINPDRLYCRAEDADVLYICDGRACDNCHSDTPGAECIYTKSIGHAKNFTCEHGVFYEKDV